MVKEALQLGHSCFRMCVSNQGNTSPSLYLRNPAQYQRHLQKSSKPAGVIYATFLTLDIKQC